MAEVTDEYLNRAELWMLLTTLAYFLMNGAQLFETAVLVPKWTAKPPGSLSVLQGPYAPDLKTFWIVAHSIHELSFIAAIIFCWKFPQIRYALLIIFGAHIAIRLWTLGYFAPNIMAFQKADVQLVSTELQAAVARWRNLNYIRVVAFVALSIGVAVIYYKTRILNSATNSAIKKDKNMEQRLSVITLGVDNLAAQKEFYKSKIGWDAVAENKDIIFFKLNGFLFSLFDRRQLAQSSGVDATGSGFRSLTISYNVPSKEDVDKMHQKFIDDGVPILKTPVATPFGGYYFTFSDLEGNVLEVAYNPYIPLDDAGNVITHNSIDNL